MQTLCPAEFKDGPSGYRSEEPPHHRHRAEHLQDMGKVPSVLAVIGEQLLIAGWEKFALRLAWVPRERPGLGEMLTEEDLEYSVFGALMLHLEIY